MQNRRKILIGLLLSSIFFTGCNKEKETFNDLNKEDTLIIEDEDKTTELTTDVDIEEDDIEINLEDDNKNESVENDENKENSNKVENVINENNMESNTNKSESTLVEDLVFTKSDITDSIKLRMEGKSMPSDSTISYDELSYLTITYLDYNGETKQGEMVVHKKLADEVLDIFKEIYIAKFPIERMRLVDDYDASDHQSMVNNNSSAFCYRTIAGTNKVSNHGKGVAIDINPFYNPHVLKSSGTVNPPEASKYANRNLNEKGMIKYNDVVYKAFVSRGWKWGGNWNNPDYQHFEKQI